MTPDGTSNLLAIAYACAPMRGSEWGLGWSFASEMAQSQPVWVITHAENRAAIESYVANNPTPHPIHFEYVTLPDPIHKLLSSGYTLFNVQYYLWTFLAARAARRLHREVGFDLVQHISLMRWWMPSAGATLATRGVKFIFGPVGGGELMPKRFRKGIGFRARMGEVIRGVAVKFWSFDPMLRRTIRNASLVLASTPETAEHLARLSPKKLMTVNGGVMSAPALIDAARQVRADLPASRPFRFLSSGGLSYFRGVDLAIHAFARANLPGAEYVHASDGPDRPRLEALARELGIADRVKFLGDRPHAENVKTVATADVYVHTVLRDSMGLIPDALALGIPVITLDHNTMAVMVDESVGHKVPIGPSATPQDVISGISQCMERWFHDAALRESLGRAGIEASKQLTGRGRSIVYQECHSISLRDRVAEPAVQRSIPATPIAQPPVTRERQTSSH